MLKNKSFFKLNFKNISLILILLLSISLVSCIPNENEKKHEHDNNISVDEEKELKVADRLNLSFSAEPTNYVLMRFKDSSDILLALYPEVAPQTVENFKNLVKENFYRNIIFHRIVPNFVIQGGDPDGNGTGGSSKYIFGEFTSNGHYNSLPHARGVLSMARAADPNSASSQFFIVLNSQSGSQLNGNYASFGRVLYGMDLVDEIAALPLMEGSEMPINPPVIEDTFFISELEVANFIKERQLTFNFELPK